MIRKILAKIPDEIKYILSLFIATRLMLIFIGVISRRLLEPYHGKFSAWIYAKHVWLDIWGVYDTGWYLKIAKGWYPAVEVFNPGNQDVYNFFPLYPALMRGVGYLTGDIYLSGIIVSNIALLIAAYYLYKLVRLDDSHETAGNSVKYMFLFPAAFIFSGVFTEALFTALLIASFYYARKEQWIYACGLGFFLAMCRVPGILVSIPLFIMYMRTINYNPLKIKSDIILFALFPLGLSVFTMICFRATGDFLAFVHIQQTAWARELHNPFINLANSLSGNNIDDIFGGWFLLVFFIILIYSAKFLRFEVWLIGVILITTPMLTGINSVQRYFLPVFALYIFFGKISSNKTLDQLLTITLAMLQGYLMMCWSNGFYTIV